MKLIDFSNSSDKGIQLYDCPNYIDPEQKHRTPDMNKSIRRLRLQELMQSDPTIRVVIVEKDQLKEFQEEHKAKAALADEISGLGTKKKKEKNHFWK